MDILSRVSTLDIEHLRFVCNGWKKIIADLEPSIIHLQCSRSNLRDSQVLIMIDCKGLYFVDMAEKDKATRKKLMSIWSTSEIIGLNEG